MQFMYTFFSILFVRIDVVHPYIRIDTITAWKKLRTILSDMSKFHVINNPSVAVYTFAIHILM